MNADHLEWALRYIDVLGAAPVPLWHIDECTQGRCRIARTRGTCDRPGKHPMVAWRDLEGVDHDQARSWWERWPHAGIGLLTGRRSGFDVIDVDPKAGGTIDVLRETVDGLPDTPTVWTGKTADGQRGAHFYIAWPGTETSNAFVDAIGVPGVDYRGDGGLVVAPPTLHASGVEYQLDNPPPTLIPTPGWLTRHATHAQEQQQRRAAAAAEVAARIAANPPELPTAGATRFGQHMAEQARDDILQAAARAGTTGGRHDTVVRKARMLGGLIPTGHITEQHATEVLIAAADATVEGEGRHAEMEEAVAWGLSKGHEQPWEPQDNSITVGTIRPQQDTTTGPSQVEDLIDAARQYLDLPDPAPLLATLAAAATRDLQDEPVWLLLVGAPSGGKTEATRVLDDAADARLDDVSAAGMLSWKGGKRPAPVGVLTRIPQPNALVTFGDLSTLLASSDRGGRDTTFSLLRKAYDGHVVRDLGNAPAALTWQGRLTIVGAVTDAIDGYAAHADALGPRWLYLRLPKRDTTSKRRAARIARRGGLDDARDRLRAMATEAVTEAASQVNNIIIDDQLADALEDAALVCAWGRATVPRHGYGRREIDGLPSIEDPGRIVRQLRGLARGAVAVGLDDSYVQHLVRRVALDSMPAARRHTLDALADGEKLSTAAVAQRAGIHRHVARRQLEELEAIGVVASERDGQEPGEDEPDRRTAAWRLYGEDGRLVARVLHEGKRPVSWVARKVGNHPPTPPIRGEDTHPSTHTSCHPPDAEAGAA